MRKTIGKFQNIETPLGHKHNKYPPAKPGVFHRRAKPSITSGTRHVALVRSASREGFLLAACKRAVQKFPIVNCSPDLFPTGAGCTPQFFYRFSLLYPHSILCTRTPFCDTCISTPDISRTSFIFECPPFAFLCSWQTAPLL